MSDGPVSPPHSGEEELRSTFFRIRLDASLSVPVAQMSLKGNTTAQSAKTWKQVVLAKLESKYNRQLNLEECVLVDNITHQTIPDTAELKGMELNQLTLKKIDADEKEDAVPADDEMARGNIASRLRKSVSAVSKRAAFLTGRPETVDIEAGHSKRFEMDMERYRRLTNGHAKVFESITRFVETATAHAEAAIKLQEDVRMFFKRSNRSECNEEFVGFHDLRLSVLESQKKSIHDHYQPLLATLQMTKQLEGFKQQVAACTDALAEINKQKRAIAISKSVLDAAMKSPTGDIEAKSAVHAKATQDLDTLYSELEKHELSFERSMDDFDASTSFALLKNMCTVLSHSLADSKFTFEKIAEMETYIESELPATISHYEDDYEKVKQQREVEEKNLKATADFQDVDLVEAKQYLQPCDPPLLQGEKVLNTATNVMNVAERVIYVLFLTNYRLVAIPYTQTRARRRDPKTIDLPLMSIVRLESTNDSKGILSIWMGDLRHYVFCFSQPLKTEISKFANVLRYFCFQVPKSFAYTLRNFLFIEEDSTAASRRKNLDVGWGVYVPEVEFTRQGVIRQVNGLFTQSASWRLSNLNQQFGICSTYPEQFVLPVDISDAEAKEAADHRTKGRLPVLCWKHPTAKVALFRGSQPKMGVTRSRKKADERMLSIFGSITSTEKKVETTEAGGKKSDGYPDCNLTSLKSFITPSTSLVIFDARPYKNAVGNVAKGGGWELPDYYTNCVCVFCDIENIHEVRGALRTLKNNFESLAKRPFEPITVLDPHEHYDLAQIQQFVRELDQHQRKLESEPLYAPLWRTKPRWYKHVSLVLKAGLVMAETLHELKLSVFSHCSDGWDRTAQLTGLTSLLLDPFYRTLKGFAVLIEKEWVSFGHKFSERMGLGAPPDKLAAKRADFQDSQRSPIFLQWIDCVFQILRQFPHAFEFNALFLADLVDHVHSCRFGTFLGNCAKDRVEAGLRLRTISLWSFVLSPRIRPYYENPDFFPSIAPLKPKCEVDDMALFLPFYQRWDPSLPPAFSLVAADGSFEFLGDADEEDHSYSNKSDEVPGSVGTPEPSIIIDDSSFPSPPSTPRTLNQVPPPPPLPSTPTPPSPSRPPPPIPNRPPSLLVLSPSTDGQRSASSSPGHPPRPKGSPRSASLVGITSARRV